ncbi:hypothetical protein PCA31118_04562 [Pandoraea captiosa]|uniref:Capsular biosynthesis protein n=1 Tax=Pandoraea captiosa TaxID=2508302 RepID=A0A5E5AN59_9BURK|nr:capsular biosynthesis protein [Pandoraea captiosa]VVE73520.1 hypothetical protein PCA31118_04562 [Pandoraea captiosa]
MNRSYLVLQGTASPFFHQLASALRVRGNEVCRVNFCGGDLVYGGTSTENCDFNAPLETLGDWYADAVRTRGVTDVLLFGDCRDVHVPMHDVAHRMGVEVHVFEEGYVRPYWITLENHGVNGRSKLPRDPAWYREVYRNLPQFRAPIATGYNLKERAFHDMRYRWANAAYAHRYRHYQSHRPRNGLFEYAGLAARAIRNRGFHREADYLTRELRDHAQRYFLFPLQLNSDAQVVVHSPFDGICGAIDAVVASFAAHAAPDTQLVIKNHPLDTGLINYRQHTLRIARRLGVANRVHFIDAGHLPTLLEHAQGVVVINSTVGLSALHHGTPLVVLGEAIYDMQGLTWQHGLDTFWQAPDCPDMALYTAFLHFVIHNTQINGDFYTRGGIGMALVGVVQRLEARDAA